ncbi:hypothetical protein Vadar_022542 [Vaccinium darrowii]|uniref:Uncharacterized protein n=1 Tax=Vaccinium darrowii TaxID=229202 RepID=A0ACB7X3K3_9ERIC|nr:hypothetical protein Vadar_022542 [Vaccinium darrowii]
MGIWEVLVWLVVAVVSVTRAIHQPIVDEVIRRSVDTLCGFVSEGIFPVLGRLWRLVRRNNPQPAAAAPILLDQGRASLTINENGKKCYMIGARGLKIARANFQAHWNWASRPHTRVLEVAELLSVWWLGFRAKMNLETLSPNTTYAIYLVFKIARDSRGLSGPATAAIRTWQSGVKTKGPRCTIFLVKGEHVTEEFYSPQERSDGWMEVKLGEFFVSLDDYRVLHLKFKLVEDKDRKERPHYPRN